MENSAGQLQHDMDDVPPLLDISAPGTSRCNHNPDGKNQHAPTLRADDARLRSALETYHRAMLTNNKKISELLLADHNISMSATTVKRRRKELGLCGSGATMRSMSRSEAQQVVLSQLDQDPAQRHGVRNIHGRIAFVRKVHLTRDFVSEVMHEHAPEGFLVRDPTAKKVMRFPKHPIGIHERWAGDGHDKLYKIGFPIWAVGDDATGKWLAAWVIPSNRMGEIIAYLFLCLVEKFKGIPLQFSTDCGSETTRLYGLVNALREIYHPEYDSAELPAHVYLRSVHNISIERSWLRLRLDWGDNMVAFFYKGIDDGMYNPDDPDQYELCQWLWPKLLRLELDNFMNFRNIAKMRKDKTKPGPSGMSRNEAFSLPGSWGGRNCLLPLDDLLVIREIKDSMGGDGILEFVSEDFAERCEQVYEELGIQKLNGENVWHVFEAMLPLLYPQAEA